MEPALLTLRSSMCFLPWRGNYTLHSLEGSVESNVYENNHHEDGGGGGRNKVAAKKEAKVEVIDGSRCLKGLRKSPKVLLFLKFLCRDSLELFSPLHQRFPVVRCTVSSLS